MSYTEIRANYVKARNNYQCEWCGQLILIGEKHLSRAYKWCGEFNTGRMHLECEQETKKLSRDELDDGWVFGSNERGVVTK